MEKLLKEIIRNRIKEKWCNERIENKKHQTKLSEKEQKICKQK